MARPKDHEELGLVGVPHEEGETSAHEDAVRRELAVERGRARHLERQIGELEERLLQAETERADADLRFRRQAALVEEIQQTLSWRITAPLRAASRVFRRG